MAESLPTSGSLGEIKDISTEERGSVETPSPNVEKNNETSSPSSFASPASAPASSSASTSVSTNSNLTNSGSVNAPLGKTESNESDESKKTKPVKVSKKEKQQRRGSWSAASSNEAKKKPLGKSLLSSTLRSSPSSGQQHRPSSWDYFDPDQEAPPSSGKAIELKVHYGSGLDSVMISRKFPIEATIAEITKTFQGYYNLTGSDWRIYFETPESGSAFALAKSSDSIRKSGESSKSEEKQENHVEKAVETQVEKTVEKVEDATNSEKPDNDKSSEPTEEKSEVKSVEANAEKSEEKHESSEKSAESEVSNGKSEVKEEKPKANWMHVDKRLSDYDEALILSSYLQMKPRPYDPVVEEKKKKDDPAYNTPISRTLSNFFLKGQKGKEGSASNGTERRKSKANPPKETKVLKKPPLPWVFLQDLNSKLSIQKTSEEEFNLEFEYSPDANMLPPWMNADKEGEVLKRGQFIKSHWNTRYLAMQGNQLFYFKTQPLKESEEPRGKFLVDEESEVKPLEDKDARAPKYGFVVDKILYEVTSSKKGEIVVVDDKYYVSTTLALCAKNKEDMETWISSIQKGIDLKDKATASKLKVESITVTFKPATGYVGLSPEWKHLLNSSAITERHFYDNPEETINLLRANFNKRDISEPIINHTPSSKARDNSANIADVVNKEDNPQVLYENFQLVGSGTFGEVFLAVNSRSAKTVAIKKMLLTPKREPLFINEISVQKVTEHPNVVRLFDSYKVNDYIWVALEFMSNGNLYQILTDFEATKHHFTESQIAYVIAESLKGLSYIHGMHRIHRDIKSDNILIGAEAEIKLADFGYAVQLGGEDEKRSTICGSPYWMAPEVILGEKYGKEVDIWSLGIMLMELCDLQPPYILEAPARALVLIPSRPVPPLKTADRWTKELKHFLSLCLQKDASLRPQAIELLQHPFLHSMCGASEFKEGVLTKRKKAAKPCLIQ